MASVPEKSSNEFQISAPHYFMPNQFLMLVTHENELDGGQIRARLNALNVEGFQNLLGEARIEPESILTFAGSEVLPQFSLVLVELPGDVEDAGLVYLTDQLYAQRQALSDEQLGVQTVTVNWLASSAPGQAVTGGPGAPPVPGEIDPQFWDVPLSDPKAPFSFRLATAAEITGIPNVALSASSTQGGEQLPTPQKIEHAVEIALLDTAPMPEQIQGAYARWHEQHPLMQSLLGPDGKLPNGRLRITYMEQMQGGKEMLAALGVEDVKETYGLLPPQYEMADHGLFAAGVAHTLAPQASLHLVQVLNPWGVGSTFTLALGLLTLLKEPLNEDVKLIVNCSLTVQFPWDKAHEHTGLPASSLRRLRRSARSRRTYIEQSMLPVLWALQALHAQCRDVLFVAAAGNDGTGKASRPLARYPAAIDGVIGAGALGVNFGFTQYSNKSDLPLNAGIATFGGDVDTDGWADPKLGMLGIYTGESFPSKRGGSIANTSGWGRWAGTSFAAPVISGVLAAKIQSGDSPDAAHDWMEDLLIELGGGDNIFPVKQGS